MIIIYSFLYYLADVSGVPGTGKTATVLGIVRELQEEVANKVRPPPLP
jgi:Cdc6-like AAA superfamily ATPase